MGSILGDPFCGNNLMPKAVLHQLQQQYVCTNNSPCAKEAFITKHDMQWRYLLHFYRAWDTK